MSEWPAEPVYEIDASGNVKQRYDGPSCPDAPHDCVAIGCGRVESWPLDGPQPDPMAEPPKPKAQDPPHG